MSDSPARRRCCPCENDFFVPSCRNLDIASCQDSTCAKLNLQQAAAELSTRELTYSAASASCLTHAVAPSPVFPSSSTVLKEKPTGNDRASEMQQQPAQEACPSGESSLDAPTGARNAGPNPAPTPNTVDDEEPLTPDEQAAEALMLQAATEWNIHQNRSKAEKLQRKALEVVLHQGVRPKLVAEVASSLADMLYSQQKYDAAEEVVGHAMAAAKAACLYPLQIKLSNNLGAVLKRLNKPDDAHALHEDAFNMALQHFGAAHPYTALTRVNLVDSLEELQRRPQARELLQSQLLELRAGDQQHGAAVEPSSGLAVLQHHASRLQAVAAPANSTTSSTDSDRQAAQPTSNPTDPPSPPSGPSSGAPGGSPYDQWRHWRAALVRLVLDCGRLETRDGNHNQAREHYTEALQLCSVLYGPDTIECGGPLAALAGACQASGDIKAAIHHNTRLFDNSVKLKGMGDKGVVLVCRTLSELCEGEGDLPGAAQWSCTALLAMIEVLGSKSHPYLEPFYQAAMSAKSKAGDEEGAEQLRKSWLKASVQIQRSAARSGPSTSAAAQHSVGSSRTGSSTGKGKKGGRGKH